jgi:hypothetical protein
MAASTTTRTARTTRSTAAKATPVEAPKVEETTVTEPTTTETTEVVVESATPAKAYLVDKDPTALHEDFRTWILEQTGYEADLKTVQIVCVLRDAYQRSDRSQAMLAARQAKADAAKAAREAASIEAKKARLAKLAAELGVTVA